MWHYCHKFDFITHISKVKPGVRTPGRRSKDVQMLG